MAIPSAYFNTNLVQYQNMLKWHSYCHCGYEDVQIKKKAEKRRLAFSYYQGLWLNFEL